MANANANVNAALLFCMQPGDSGHTYWSKHPLLLNHDIWSVNDVSVIDSYDLHITQDLTNPSFYTKNQNKFNIIIVDLNSLCYLIAKNKKPIYEFLIMLVAKNGSLYVEPSFQKLQTFNPKCYDCDACLTPCLHGDPFYEDHFNCCELKVSHVLALDFICVPSSVEVEYRKKRVESIKQFLEKNKVGKDQNLEMLVDMAVKS